MDWKTMQTDLQRLGVLIDGWSQTDQIPAVECDLALAKLRELYEAIRFSGALPEAKASTTRSEPEPGPETPETELPESLDLGAVLSLDGFPDLEESEGAIFVEPASPFAPEPGETPTAPAAADAGTEAAEPAAADESNELTGISGPVVVSEPTILSESDVEKPAAAEPVAAEPVAAEPAAAEPAAAEPVAAEPAAAEPAAAESAAAEPAGEEPAAVKPRHASTPTLFGPEDEETIRHRHKQRVIMSLYGPSPEPERHVTPERPAGQPSAAPHPARDVSSEPLEVIEIVDNPEIRTDTAVPVGETAPESVPGPVAGPESPENGKIPTPAGPAGPEVADDDSLEATAEDAAPTLRESPEEGPKPSACDPDPDDSDRRTETGIPIPTGGAVLGEVINHDVQTLADTIAPPRDVASELRHGGAITDLRQAIGLNDKFLLIRDLFGGDAEAFDRAVETLNGFDDLDDCMIFIAEHYAWNPNSDGAKLMMELLEHKFA